MSKREEEKAVEAAKRVADQARSTADKQEAAATLQEIRQQEAAQHFQQTVNASLDETKDNIRKSLNETKNQIPQYTDVVKNYQEKALDSTRKIVEDYIEAQKSVINSVFSSANVYYDNVQRMYSYWLSPRVPTELWARSVSNIAENVSAATRINNDILFGNIDAFGNAFERVQRQTEELSRINVDNAKTIANTAAEFSANRQREVYR
jgi:vacuolar-type H+-ATPase subunit I/STV1